MTDAPAYPARERLDPEMAAAAAEFAASAPDVEISAEALPMMRVAMAEANPTPAEAIGGRAIEAQERLVPGPAGAPDVELTILRPSAAPTNAPALFNIHGGGTIVDTRYSDLPRLVGLVEEFGMVAATVEYRLTPENPHPAPIEDCYAGLEWMAGHAAELGFDPAKLIVCGGSAGGGLSAGVSLLARDRGGPTITGQLLLCPMLDDRNNTSSAERNAEGPVWTRQSNEFGWRSLLGSEYGTANVSAYAAPARARDLSGLPDTFIEVGSAEVFLDEDVEFADRLWKAGVPTELHVWAGAFHGFDRFAPASTSAESALATRSSWIRRTLRLTGRE